MHFGLQLPPSADFQAVLRDVQAAEQAGFSFVWLAEGLTLSSRPAEGRLPFDPTLLASALAARTDRIGIMVTAAPARHEPYNLARRLASLDWISQGRIGWMVDAGEDTARETEYLGLLRDLWDSWDDDAFIHDKAAGRFFQPDKMHVLDHRGAHFSVRGPLNVNRSPQGHPVVAGMAGAAIAALADVVLVPEGAVAPGESGRTPLRLGGWTVPGDPPRRLADGLEAEAERLGLDGFVVAPADRDVLAGFITEGMPELARRGVVAEARSGDTLRDRLGLPRPALPVLEASA